jgi:hypothetical protein
VLLATFSRLLPTSLSVPSNTSNTTGGKLSLVRLMMSCFRRRALLRKDPSAAMTEIIVTKIAPEIAVLVDNALAADVTNIQALLG